MKHCSNQHVYGPVEIFTKDGYLTYNFDSVNTGLNQESDDKNTYLQIKRKIVCFKDIK